MNTQTNLNENWRHEAINESLRGFGYAENLDALMREIRVALPEAATLILWPDRLQLLRFLKNHATGLRSLLPGQNEYYYESRSQARHHVGWFAAEWHGETLEIAIPPSTSDADHVICIGPRPETLSRFAQELMTYANRPLGRCLRYTQGWEGALDLDTEIGKVTWDDVVLPLALLARLREAVEGFVQHREAFTALGFPWKRGILLIGPPGTGNQ